MSTAFLLVSLWSSGQRIEQCDSLRNFWVFEDDSPAFSFELNGRLMISENPEAVGLDDHALISQFSEKNKYLTGETKKNTEGMTQEEKDQLECEILIEWLKKTPHPEMKDITMQKAPIEGEKFWLVIQGKLLNTKSSASGNKNDRMKFLIQACTISGDKIFCLTTVQFADQQLDDCYAFLLEVIKTYKEF
jgi:hypothetical protein